MGKMGRKVDPVDVVKKKEQVKLQRVKKGRGKILEVVLLCFAYNLTWGDSERDGGMVLKGLSVKEFFTRGEAREENCNLSKTSFGNYMRQLKKHVAEGNSETTFQLPEMRGGNNGGKCGRPSIDVNGNVTDNKADIAARAAMMNSKRSKQEYDDYSKAEAGFHHYAVPPMAIPFLGNNGLMTESELKSVVGVVPKMFNKANRSNTYRDTSLIHDKPSSPSNPATGQRRIVLFHTKLTRAKNGLSNPEVPKQEARSDMMLLPNNWWSSIMDGTLVENIIRRIGDGLAANIRAGALKEHFKPDEGFPKGCHETEAFRTPPGADAQEAHQDSRFHMAIVGLFRAGIVKVCV